MIKSGDNGKEHMIKQRKKKGLPNSFIYGSQNGIVELHELKNYEINDKKLGIIIKELIEENENLNTRVDNTKTALKTILDRVEKIERKMSSYGIE